MALIITHSSRGATGLLAIVAQIECVTESPIRVSPSEQALASIRLSQPRTLKSLVERYSKLSNDELLDGFSNTLDFQIGVGSQQNDGIHESPYALNVRARPILAERADDYSYLDQYMQLRGTIISLVNHAETLFPGEFLAKWALHLEDVILPSLEKRPLSCDISDISDLPSGNDGLERIMSIIDLFTPNALLICRLDRIVDGVISQINNRLLHA
jgi:hypothetical protein